jgi:metal-sulfur cluster biosynthetic enzyme
MSAPTEQRVFETLRGVRDPEINHDIVELGMVRDVEVEDGVVYVYITPTSAHCPFADEIVGRIRRAVGALDGVREVDVEWGGGD